MAKKRDRKEIENPGAERASQTGVLDPRAFEGQVTNFAESHEQNPSEGDIEAWEDEETAPDLFASASDEDRVQASGGHTQRPDEEPKGSDSPDRRR